MWYTIILLSIALAVSVVLWVKADRMAGHYRRERNSANADRDWAENNWIIAADNRELSASNLRKARRQLAAVLVSCLCGLLLYRSNERLRMLLTEWHVMTIIMGDKVEAIADPIEQFRRGEISRDELLMVLDLKIDRARCHLSVMDSMRKKSPSSEPGQKVAE